MGDATFLSGNRTKAGLPENDGLERSRIDEIIKETSLGSRYYQYQERHEKKIEERVSKLIQKREQLERSFQNDPEAFLRQEKELERWIEVQESGRDLSRTFMHIDMDAFFAAVETLDHPEWTSIPMAVGGDSMLSTSNYEARKYGVVAAMPGYIARKLCPNLLIVPPNYDKYRQAAAKFHPVFAKYDQDFTHFSLDEANLDLTDWLKENPGTRPEDLVQRIRKEVFEASGLTCSAGIAPNKLLAKICSNIKKPNGQYYLPPVKLEIIKFIEETPLRKLSGIGKWEHRFWVWLLFSQLQADFLLRSCMGLGTTSHFESADSNRQSISVERTFKPINELDKMIEVLKPLCNELSGQLEEMEIVGKTLSIKMKTKDFEVSTRSVTLKRYIACESDLLKYSTQLLTKYQPANLRLLGVRLSLLLDQNEIDDVGDLQNFVQLLEYDQEAIRCPICLKAIGKEEQDPKVNEHIDDCLARQLLDQSQTIQKPSPPQNKKRKTLDGFFKKL